MSILTLLSDPAILKKIAIDVPITNLWPEHVTSIKEIDDFLATAVREVASLKGIVLDATTDSYGSGFASYFHLHCNKPDDLVVPSEGVKTIQGLTIYMCRLFPVFVFGPEFRYLDVDGIATTFLNGDRIDELPPGEWSTVLSEILSITDRYGLQRLTKANCMTKVADDIVWESNGGTKTIFDLLFRWVD
jgi:hypothetical protein